MDLLSNFPNDWFGAQCIQENICEEVLGEQVLGFCLIIFYMALFWNS